MPDVPELFQETGAVFPCFAGLMMMPGGALGVLAALASTHVKPPLGKIRWV